MSTGEPPTYHLAQVNLGRFHHPVDDPRNAEFVDNLDRINLLAEEQPGFVWRLKGDDGGPSSYLAISDDPLLAINLSVWENGDAFWSYVYKTEHVTFLRRRRQWFQPMEEVFSCCWWVPAGHRPGVDEAMKKLDQLDREGPGDEVFLFRRPFPEPPTG
ncbi:MAG: DUF3291 domain-containing protein [Actinomycetota bacterium]